MLDRVRTVADGCQAAAAGRACDVPGGVASSGLDSMITRHGRSASTVSSVRPNSDDVLRRLGGGHHDRAGPDLARLVHDPPARLTGADLLPVAGHAPAADHAGPSR